MSAIAASMPAPVEDTTDGVVPSAPSPGPRDLFPRCVTIECVRFAPGPGPGDEARFASVHMPVELCRAVAKRRLEFLAGRWCAEAAVRRLGPGLLKGPIPIGADRAPEWPAGVVGAITHTRGFAAAAVARVADTAGIGLDSEPVVSASVMDAVGAQVATGDEMRELARAGLGEAVALTVLFSAKESVFKCLYRLVGRFFDFHDVAIVDVDEGALTFAAELRTALGGFAAGTKRSGRFAVVDGFVHTGITLPPSRPL
jgi:enterobactin synthetase component D